MYSSTPNLLGQRPQQLIEYVKNSDLSQAQKSFYQQLPLLRFIVNGGLPKTIKAGLELKVSLQAHHVNLYRRPQILSLTI